MIITVCTIHSIDSNNVTPEHRVRSLTIRNGQSQTTIRWPAGCLSYPVEIGMRDRGVISGFTLLLPVWGSRHKTTERNNKMATRSNINVKVGDVYHCIYCHFDGYPDHHAPILTGYYNSQEMAEKLVSNGDMSSLDESCDKPEGHSFETRVNGYTVYYGRDRGEKNVDFKVLTTPLAEEEYSYTWDGEKWLCDGEAILPEENDEIDTKNIIAQLLEDARRLQQLEPNAGTASRIEAAEKALA